MGTNNSLKQREKPFDKSFFEKTSNEMFHKGILFFVLAVSVEIVNCADDKNDSRMRPVIGRMIEQGEVYLLI